MAKCDEGYRCDVCGEDVTSIVESDLYLRFVIGHLDPEKLHVAPERHLRCNPVLSQCIRDERFDEIEADGPFRLSELDPKHAADMIDLVTRGYRRLWEIIETENDRDVTEYPLPEVRARYQ
ncbi:hypothetical protein LOC71_22540 [Rhodopirellula sp. JC740]|uniref:Phage protein n=1 Tax=Rhodopirellula halodulae TaxID=2894198 RepID=A0ABS8NNH6_9BACT|nr:hypothetical protein [Rhodopirellula sp. JC740]MCC9645066.1 hypothetical protein [Rhodopirellula sp. JC740]